jgi:hypothetical protein
MFGIFGDSRMILAREGDVSAVLFSLIAMEQSQRYSSKRDRWEHLRSQTQVSTFPVPFSQLTSTKSRRRDRDMYKKALLTLTVLVLAGSTTFAGQSTKEGVITTGAGDGPRQTLFLKAPTYVGSPVDRPAKLKTIYDNLGTGTNVYNCCTGWNVTGKTSQVGVQTWSATPFTPKTAATLTEIQIAIEWVNGQNGAIVTLNTDKAGVPSTKVLQKWVFKNLHSAGTCCALSTGKLKTGIKLAKGKQYWVVAMCPTTTWAAWNLNSTGAVGNLAQQNNGGSWKVYANSTLGAMGLFGQ